MLNQRCFYVLCLLGKICVDAKADLTRPWTDMWLSAISQLRLIWAEAQRFLQDCRPSKTSDQPTPLHSLIRIFARYSMDSQGVWIVFRQTARTLIRLCRCRTAPSLRWALMQNCRKSCAPDLFSNCALCSPQIPCRIFYTTCGDSDN